MKKINFFKIQQQTKQIESQTIPFTAFQRE